MRRYSLVSLLVAGGMLAACGSSTTAPADSGAGTDVPVADTPAVDTPATDGGGGQDSGGGQDAATDAATGNTCVGLPVIDLASAGMRTGDTTHYTGDNSTAFTMQTMGHPTGHQTIAPPTGRTDCPTSSGEVVMKYTTGAMPAVLRISTTNPGTPHSFDTVLYVTGTCRSTLASATLCNDDDPTYASSADRRVSSLVTTGVLAAHSVLYIVLGGFYPPTTDGATIDHGAFELTVQELNPVAMGGACATDGSSMICATGLTCVGSTPLATTGTCQADGTAAGARCRTSTPNCDSGLTCDMTLTVPTCVHTVAAGMPCDGYNECDSTSSCVNNSFAGPAGVCHARGEVGTACRPMGATGGRCNTGLTCNSDLDPTITSPVCVNVGTTAGAACDLLTNFCGMGLTCVTLDNNSFIGRCVADGTASRTHCRATMPACDGTLSCQPVGAAMVQTCVNVATAGGACTPDAQCPTGTTCLLTDLTDRQRGTCTTDGSLGGLCTGMPTACTGSLTCNNPTNPAQGLCQNTQMMAGGTCNTLTQGCATGLTCVLTRDATGHPDTRNGTCRTNGTSAGSACRPGDMPCDTSAMLACGGTVLSGGVCQAAVATGAACDSLNGSTVCATGAVCRPTTYNTGTCVTGAVMETEPTNNSPAALRAAMTAAITAPTSITGTLPFGDVDCVAVTVPAMGGILAQVDDGNGRCPVSFGGDLLIDVYGTDGTTIRGESQDSGPGRCATIDGARTVMSGGMAVSAYPYASNLAAGTYYVCARGLINATTREFSTATSYVLHVAPLAAH